MLGIVSAGSLPKKNLLDRVNMCGFLLLFFKGRRRQIQYIRQAQIALNRISVDTFKRDSLTFYAGLPLPNILAPLHSQSHPLVWCCRRKCLYRGRQARYLASCPR